MSAAAGSHGNTRARYPRLRALVDWADAALTTGRLPALLVAIICGAMLWGFLATDDYRVQHVTISGLEYGDAQAVEKQAQLLDAPLFTVAPEEVAERIAALPNIEHVRVDVRFPDAAIIMITERAPAINIQAGDETRLLSADAALVAEEHITGLPVLEVAADADVGAIDEEIVAATVSITAVYGPEAGLTWDANIGLALDHPAGGVVIFGEPVDIDAKLAVLAAVEGQLSDDWSQLDIRVPSRPAYR